jgi:1-acyl-sn-glycerol-3-phosphate acyltransferase
MDPQPEKKKHLDVKAIFFNKNPRLAHWIPGFIYQYLKRILHEDFFNDILNNHGDKKNLEFLEAVIKDFNVTIESIGEENLPKEGRYIFACNHPLGGFDGIVLMKIIGQRYGKIKYLVNDILMNLVNIKELFIPINKHGSQGVLAVKHIDEAYNSDTQILTCPAGLVSRKVNGQVMDLPWQKSFIQKAVKHQRNVIPVHFSGRNTNFFYNLSNFRKFLGIKATIEMLYLADETVKHQNKHLVIRFGKPIPWQTFDDSKKPMEWAKWVKEKVYTLAGITSVPF